MGKKSPRGEWCWYCNEVATSRDHIKPQSATHPHVKSITVPCCQSCNSMLGNIHLHTDRQRGQYLAHRLLIKLYEAPRIGDWSDKELLEFGYSLRTLICSKINKQEMLERRAGYALRQWGRSEPYPPSTETLSVPRDNGAVVAINRPRATNPTEIDGGVDETLSEEIEAILQRHTRTRR